MTQKNKEININEVYLWDCLEIMKAIPDGSIDAVITDPPYWMDFQSNYRKEKYNKIQNDSNIDWINDFIDEIYRVMKTDTHWYIFCSFHNVDKFKQSIERKFKFKNILIWEKNNTSMGDLTGDYAPKYEMVLFFHKWRRRLLWWFRYANIFKFNRTWNNFHPTEKPIDLMEFLIKNSTLENEIILDCFAWSWTTWVACKNTNRNYILIEKDEWYYNTIISRLWLQQ